MSEKDLFLKSFEEKLSKKLDKKDLLSLKSGDFEYESEMTQDYETFRKENLPNSFSIYEKLCNLCSKILPLDSDEKTKAQIEKHIENSHLNISTQGVMSLTVLTSLLIGIIGVLFFVFERSALGLGFIILSVSAYFIVQKIPELFAIHFKNKANDQIIVAVFYIVAYMRFNSNFELATHFAANYFFNVQ